MKPFHRGTNFNTTRYIRKGSLRNARREKHVNLILLFNYASGHLLKWLIIIYLILKRHLNVKCISNFYDKIQILTLQNLLHKDLQFSRKIYQLRTTEMCAKTMEERAPKMVFGKWCKYFNNSPLPAVFLVKTFMSALVLWNVTQFSFPITNEWYLPSVSHIMGIPMHPICAILIER